MVNALSEDTSTTSSTCTDTCLTNEEPEHYLEAPPPSPAREPLGHHPPCEGCEAIQVNHELVVGDAVAMTMTHSRKRQMKKSLKKEYDERWVSRQTENSNSIIILHHCYNRYVFVVIFIIFILCLELLIYMLFLYYLMSPHYHDVY